MAMRRSLVLLLAGVLMLAVATAPATAQPSPVTPATPEVIDGPSADIVGLDGMAVAHDGTGGLVYVKDLSGVPHVFASTLAGSFQPPVEVDSTLTGASTQPVIAAANNGLLLVAFVNGGNLYVVSRTSATAALSQPQELAQGASNPAIELNPTGEGYVAFTAADPSGGNDVRSAYYYRGTWQLESSPLNATAGDDAGTGSGRPALAVAGDGVATVVWGEDGHIYSRRVWAATPSVDYERADVPALSGWGEVSADQPEAATGADSSYVAVVFHEVLTNGSATQSRVLLRRLVAGAYQPTFPADGLTTPGADGGEQPQVALTDYARGFATSSRQASDQVVATILNQNAVPSGVVRVDTLTNASAPYPVPASAGLISNLIAWQHDPGSGGTPEIRFRYAADGSDMGPELVLSSPALGPADAADGLFAGGDYNGNSVVAWVQGSPGELRIVADQLYKAPGGFGNGAKLTYVRSPQPVLSWSSSHDNWGPISYTVTLDGVAIGHTNANVLRVPAPLTNGPHTWQVIAANAAGLQNSTGIATVFVDTVPPEAAFFVNGVHRAGRVLHLAISDADLPPAGLPASDASGVATVAISWGDHSGATGRSHFYARAGTYTVRVKVTDKAGNSTTATLKLKIAPKPVKKKKKKKKPKKAVNDPRTQRGARVG
jgi:hypothetical protein